MCSIQSMQCKFNCKIKNKTKNGKKISVSFECFFFFITIDVSGHEINHWYHEKVLILFCFWGMFKPTQSQAVKLECEINICFNYTFQLNHWLYFHFFFMTKSINTFTPPYIYHPILHSISH